MGSLAKMSFFVFNRKRERKHAVELMNKGLAESS